MTTLELPDLETQPHPEPRRDNYGRYLIVPANGGKPRAYTRATTWAKALDDMEGLINWSMRMTARGLVERPDLYAQVAACRPDDKQLKALVEDAKEAGGGSAGRNVGSALHAFTERVDLGEDVTVPDPWKADVDAYKAALHRHRLKVRRDLIERVVVLEELGVAGTFDRVYVCETTGRLVIGDVKTGQSLDFSRLSIAVQLALYAHADTIYDLNTEHHEPMIDVDKGTALVVHLPSGQGRCEIVEFDIAEGWKYAQLAGLVRSARAHGRRKAGDCLARPYKTEPVVNLILTPTADEAEPAWQPPTPIGDRAPVVAYRAWVAARLETLKRDCRPAALVAIERWPKDVPFFKDSHEHTLAELRQVAAVLDTVERDFSVPFGQPDPTLPPPATFTIPTKERVPLPPLIDEGGPADVAEVAKMLAAVDALDPAVRAVLNQWAAEAHQIGRTFSLKLARTTRRLAIYEAVLALAALIDSDDLDMVRATVALVHPDAAQLAVPIGHAIGALTLDQARRLADLASTVVDTHTLTYQPDGTPVWTDPNNSSTNR